MGRLESASESMVSAVGSTLGFISAFIFTWMVGSSIGMAIHGFNGLSNLFFAGVWAFLVGPIPFGPLFFLNWILLTIWFGVGILSDSGQRRIAILLLIFVLGIFAGYRSIFSW